MRGDVDTSTGRERRLTLAAVAALLALAAAIGATLFDGSSGGRLPLALASASARCAAILREWGALLPLGYAFAAGMMAAGNPCGWENPGFTWCTPD